MSAVSRALSAVSVLLLALWLSPADFGYWASAYSAMWVVLSMVNFGEVNAYLSGHGSDFATTRRSTFRMNLLLTAIAGAISGVYLLAGNTDVGVLGLFIAASVPLTGDSDLLYAAAVRHKKYRAVLVSQVGSAVVKLGVGVLLAAWTDSAIAIAIATLVYYAAQEIVLWPVVARAAKRVEPPSKGVITTRQRFAWAANSYFMALPVQAALFVAQFLATPYVLGVFYLAFQATLSVSGVLVPSIARVSLSTFAASSPLQRVRAARRLTAIFGAALLAIAALAGLVGPFAMRLFGEDWAVALPVAVILLASLPMRIMGPILDAYQQSDNRWWQSTAFSVADTVLTALAATTALMGNVLALASAVSLAKVTLGAVRTYWVFRDQTPRHWIALVAPVTTGGLCVVVGVLAGGVLGAALMVASLGIATAWLAALRGTHSADPITPSLSVRAPVVK
ncbi:oligosaccharide flippase family protein [Micromonospora chersina]|uniref:oligosaccharide flippase family protein n=1 Tax=Micromonospora chersina TaxID=47854 RepID=UPI003718C9C5